MDRKTASSKRWLRMLGALGLVFVLLTAATAPAAAAQHGDDKAFVVELHADGSATVTLQLAYDLNSDAERAAFRDLKNNETLQQRAKSDFLQRMQSVAAAAENATGRNMSVHDPRIAFRMVDGGSTGIVELTVTWDGLAAVKDDTLRVTEPFASGFEPNRTFTIRGPDGYHLSSVTPKPDTRQANSATWDAGSNLSGFRVVFEPAETPTPTPTPTPTETQTPEETPTKTQQKGPGFSAFAGVIALLAAAVLATRPRR